MKKDVTDVGRAVRIVRSALSLNQTQLANICGCEASYVSRVESGQRVGNLNLLTAISRIAKIPMDVLLALGSREPRDDFPDKGAEFMRWLLTAKKPVIEQPAEAQ